MLPYSIVSNTPMFGSWQSRVKPVREENPNLLGISKRSNPIGSVFNSNTYEVRGVHDAIFNWVGAINGELEVQLLPLVALSFNLLNLHCFLGNFLLGLNGSLQRSSLFLNGLLGSGFGRLFHFLGLLGWLSSLLGRSGLLCSGRLLLSRLKKKNCN